MRTPRPLLRLALAFIVLSFGSLRSTAIAAEETYRWDSVSIGGGGFVTALVPSKTEPGLIYARTDVGGAYRWDANAQRWIPLTDWVSPNQVGYLGVESIAIDEQSPNKLYLLVGISYFNSGETAILRSDDYGDSFEIVGTTDQFKAHGNGMGRQNGETLQVDPNNGSILYCGTRYNGLFKSYDAGQTWTRLAGLDITITPNARGISFVLLDPASVSAGATQTLFIGVSRYGDNLYRSDDGGSTFSLVNNSPTDLMPQRSALASDGHLFITYANGAGPHDNDATSPAEPMNDGQIWKYHTETDTWTDVTPADFATAYSGISVDPQNPQRLVASTINTYREQEPGVWGDRLFLTTDGGENWKDLVADSQSFDLNPGNVTWIEGHSIHWAGSIEFDPFDTSQVWVTSGNGIFRTDTVDAPDNTWTFTVEGLEETVPLGLVSIPDGPLISVIGDYDGFRHHQPDQYAPIHQPSMGTTTGLAVAAQNLDVMLRVGNAMYRSENGGLEWSSVPESKGAFGQVAVSADGGVFLHCPENSLTTYRSTDEGASWTPVTGLSIQDARPIADPGNASKFYVYGGSSFYVSLDGGASFSATASLPSSGSRRLATVLGHEGQIWFAHESEGLYRSTDSGSSFNKSGAVESARAIGTGKASDGSDYPTLYIWGKVEGALGVFRSTDEGATWLRINDAAHQYGGPGNGEFVIGDQNLFGRVYMSTAGRGIVYGEPSFDSISYDEWAKTVFSAKQLANSSLSGERSDPDHDGLYNLVEWILQTQPLQTTDLAARTFAFSAHSPKLVVEQLANLSSATLTLEFSTDLKTWSPIEAHFAKQPASPASNTITTLHSYLPATLPFPQPFFLRTTASR